MDSIDEALNKSLKIPIVFPWMKKPRCPKCGSKHQSNPHWFRGLVMAFQRRTYIEQHYCPGKLNPTVDVAYITPHGTHKQEVNLPCFGVTEEHIHCECGCCHYSFFMRTYANRGVA